MGRYIGPACRLCRREAMKLFLKGQRCYMSKCPIETGRPAPGMHGAMRRGKPSDYGIQMREKQRMKRSFGLQEGQFRLFFDRALKRRGVTGEQLLQSLEMRLDNLVYRMGFAPSRRAARQFVLHNHVTVNQKKANIPSIVLKAGDVVTVRDKPASRQFGKEWLQANESRGVVAWLAVDKEAFSGKIDHMPTREEIAPAINEQLVVELYSK